MNQDTCRLLYHCSFFLVKYQFLYSERLIIMSKLKEGIKLIHVYGNTTCTIVDIDDYEIVIKLDKEISGKELLRLPISHLGEHLFFDVEDVDKSINSPEMIDRYLQFGNRKISEVSTKTMDIGQKNKSVESGSIEYNEKRQYLVSRGANFFVHFTNVKNVESILKNGLLSINKLQEMNLIKDTIRNDLSRYDKRNDTISLSIAFPNYMYFYKVRKNKCDSIWVVLLINTDNLDFKKMSFCKDNAATTKEVNDMKSKYLLSDLKELFTDYDRRRTRSNLEIPDNYTTNPQSEILYRGEINSSSIKNICFRTEAERNDFICSNEHLAPEILKKCIVKSEYFNSRLDYEWWRSNG